MPGIERDGNRQDDTEPAMSHQRPVHEKVLTAETERAGQAGERQGSYPKHSRETRSCTGEAIETIPPNVTIGTNLEAAENSDEDGRAEAENDPLEERPGDTFRSPRGETGKEGTGLAHDDGRQHTFGPLLSQAEHSQPQAAKQSQPAQPGEQGGSLAIRQGQNKSRQQIEALVTIQD